MGKITNETLYDLKNVSQPVVVAEQIFYLETAMNREDNRYDVTIWARPQSGGAATRYGTDGTQHGQLQEVPEQGAISFLAPDKNKKQQVFKQSVVGGSPEQLTEEKEGVGRYEWLAGGEVLYYQTTVKLEEADDDAAAESKTDDTSDKLPQPTHATRLVHKIDGGTFIDETKIPVIKRRGADGEVTEVFRHPESTSLALAGVLRSEAKLYVLLDKEVENEWVYGTNVYVYDVETGALEPLVELPGESLASAFYMNASESEQLLVGNDFSYQFVTQNNIYRVDESDRSLTNLTEDWDVDLGDSIVADFQQNQDFESLWWLDDRHFLVLTTERGQTNVYRMSVDGEREVVLDEALHVTGLAVLSCGEKLALTYATTTRPSVLALYDLKTQEWTELYDPNEQALKDLDVVTTEEFSYEGADGWDIHAWYLPPLGVASDEKHPLILYIHGGPQVCYGQSFFHEMQALAAAGYGVLMPNPRGGSSYGQEFVASILGDYGHKDYEDLMLGVDHVLESHPQIDEDALFVAGGSYGGFMTNWIVTQTDRFRAAVSQRSICNWISFYGTSDIGPLFVECQLHEDLSGHERLWQMSPLAHTENLKTPLRLLHGQNDLRCPLEQAEQMYRAARKQSVATDLITYPQSSHGLSREGLPNLRQERLSDVREWFDRYLSSEK